jgi:hypothetical protein
MIAPPPPSPPPAGGDAGAALVALAGLPGVADDVEAAREACERLRWHPAMRRRSAECRAESAVWSARASAALEGARLPVPLVRDAVRGAAVLPADAAGRVVAGATRAVAEAERMSAAGARTLTAAPRQALVRLHLAAATGVLADEAVGRPRRQGEVPVGPDLGLPPAPSAADALTRLDSLTLLLGTRSSAPVLVVSAVAMGEILTAAPFLDGNGVVARALARALVVGLGLDPMGVAVPESAALADPVGYARALAGYASGTAEGVAGWLRFCAGAVVAGAAEGTVIADAVLAGRTPAS